MPKQKHQRMGRIPPKITLQNTLEDFVFPEIKWIERSPKFEPHPKTEMMKVSRRLQCWEAGHLQHLLQLQVLLQRVVPIVASRIVDAQTMLTYTVSA